MKPVSIQTLNRLPVYLNYLQSLKETLPVNISSKAISEALGFGEIQVRKDLASISDNGSPKLGYNSRLLILDLKNYLGYNDVNNAVIVGAGKLGRALMSYGGFKEYGLNIVAAFDTAATEGETEDGKPIYPVCRLRELCERMKIHIGIVTVPAENAQDACDMLVESDILAIWNFAPAHLNVPPAVLVKNENMASSLAILSQHLRAKIMNEI